MAKLHLSIHSVVVLAGASLACVRVSPSLPSADAAAATPEDVTRAFLVAAADTDPDRFKSLLTAAARVSLEEGGGLQLDPADFEEVDVGTAALGDGTAYVPVRIEKDGRAQELKIALRREDDRWKIFGVRVAMGFGPEVTLDFAQVSSMIEAFSRTLGGGQEARLPSGVRTLSGRLSERERRRKEVAFDALRAVSKEAFEAQWRAREDFRGRPAAAALRELAGALDLTVEPGPYAKRLRQPVATSVAGLSRLAAIAAVAREAGLFPLFPSAGGAGSGVVARAVAFAEGTPDLPRVYAGPFVVSVEAVDENVPHATGTLTVAVRAYGLDAGILGLLESHAESASFSHVADASARSLKLHEDVRYRGGAAVRDGVYEETHRIELKNLVRDVTKIGIVRGSQRLLLPTVVVGATFDDLTKESRYSAGDLEVWVREVGLASTFEVRAPPERLEGLLVRAWPFDAAGRNLDVVFESATRRGRERHEALIRTTSPPARVRLKLVAESEVLEYPFELRDIPLARHQDMPRSVAPLHHPGFERPVEVEFVRLVGRDEEFPRVGVRVHNRSNKDCLRVEADFLYLDEKGAEIESFPHTLSGRYAAGGYQPVAAAGAVAEVEVTAFFLPPQTRELRVVVEEVSFVDATFWQR